MFLTMNKRLVEWNKDFCKDIRFYPDDSWKNTLK